MRMPLLNATNTGDLTQSEQNVSHFLYFDIITLHFGGIPSRFIWSSDKCISVLCIQHQFKTALI